MTNDNDFPPLIDPKGFAKGYAYKLNEYEQAGTDIPARKFQDEAFKAYGQPLQQGMSISGQPTFETLLAADPLSFDLRYKKMPMSKGQPQSLEGVPNASPELVNKLIERKLRNPGGQELPGFLKGV